MLERMEGSGPQQLEESFWRSRSIDMQKVLLPEVEGWKAQGFPRSEMTNKKTKEERVCNSIEFFSADILPLQEKMLSQIHTQVKRCRYSHWSKNDNKNNAPSTFTGAENKMAYSPPPPFSDIFWSFWFWFFVLLIAISLPSSASDSHVRDIILIR